MQTSLVQSQPVVKKVAKVSKKRSALSKRPAQRAPRTSYEVELGITLADLNAHSAALDAQLEQYGDVLFA